MHIYFNIIYYECPCAVSVYQLIENLYCLCTVSHYHITSTEPKCLQQTPLYYDILEYTFTLFLISFFSLLYVFSQIRTQCNHHTHIKFYKSVHDPITHTANHTHRHSTLIISHNLVPLTHTHTRIYSTLNPLYKLCT